MSLPGSVDAVPDLPAITEPTAPPVAADFAELLDDSDLSEEDVLEGLPLYTALDDKESPPPCVRGRTDHLYGYTDGGSCLCTCLGPPPHTQPRRFAINIVESCGFEVLVLVTILLNCVTMAMEAPTDDLISDRRRMLKQLDLGFLIVYTVEQALTSPSAPHTTTTSHGPSLPIPLINCLASLLSPLLCEVARGDP